MAVAIGNLRNYIAFMPKTPIRYDTRLELTLESELKQAVIAYAKRKKISVNEAIRQAIREKVNAKRDKAPANR